MRLEESHKSDRASPLINNALIAFPDTTYKDECPMATDYDAPRRREEDEMESDSLEGLKAAESNKNDMDDDGEIVEPFELPAVDLSGEELNVTVIPRQADEFTCSECFLVQRNNRIDHVEDDGSVVCKDCA